MPPKGKGAAWSRLKAQQAVDTLSAAASDLTQQADKITELVEYLKTGVPTPEAFGDMLRQTRVLSVLLSVVTARMQQQDVRKQELRLFWEVCIGLTQCMGGWGSMCMVQPGFFGSQPSLERQISTADLLPALAKTAATLTAAFKQQQRQQQQQQQGLPEAIRQYSVDDCLRLSSAVLQVWKLVPMMLQQRGAMLIQPTLLPMTKLAMATMRACTAAAPPGTSNISRPSSSSKSSSMGWYEIAMKQAAGTAGVLGTVLNLGVMTDTAGVQRQLQDHREMLELLFANVAAMASQLYYQMGGKTIVQIGSQPSSSSSSSTSSGKAASKKGKPSSSTHSSRQQKHECPCLHASLFNALGCANAAAILGVPEDKMDAEQAVQGVTQACSTVCTALQLLGDPSFAAEFGSLRQGAQQEQWRHLLTPEVCLGLLDATLQLLLLQPDIAVADTALAMVYQACSYTCAAKEHERWQDALWTEQSAAACMQQLLSWLVPAVQHSVQADSILPSARRGRAEQESATVYGLGRLLTLVALKADDILLVPVLSANLPSAAAALEAALRCQSRPSSAELQTFDGMHQSEVLYALHRIAHTISLTAGFSFSWGQEVLLQEAAPAADEAAAAKARLAAAAAAIAEEETEENPSGVNIRAMEVAKQTAHAAVKLAKAGARPAQIGAAAAEIHALLTTCCKYAARVFKGYPSMRENYGLEVATAANTTRAAAKAVFSKLRDADAAADAAPWVALVARCMQLSGAAVAAAVLAPESAQRQSGNQRPAVMNNPSNVLQLELDDVDWLMQHLQALSSSSSSSSAALGPTAAALQQLQELQEELELGLWKAIKALGNWSEKAVETAADLLQEIRREVKPALAQQLEAFGAAVAAEVPVKTCCNRPGCANLGQMSEAVLIGGKGNICSGCKVARYCGKDCQVQHWKQHKAACKRIQGAKAS